MSNIDVALGSVEVDHQRLTVDWSTLWSRSAQLDARSDASELHITATVLGTSDRMFFGKPVDDAVPAIVDPFTASTATGALIRDFASQRAIVQRFSSAEGTASCGARSMMPFIEVGTVQCGHGWSPIPGAVQVAM